jgi:hypothetical protein
MAFDLDIMRTQVRGMRDMLPITVTFGGADYTGWDMQLKDDRRMELYGTGSNVDYSIGFITEDFATVPALGELMTVLGVEYRVVGRDYVPSRIDFRVDLGEKFA